MKNDTKQRIGLYLNISIIVFELIAIAIYVNYYGFFILAYYTTLSNYIALAASCLYVFTYFTGSLKKLTINLRFISCTALTLTFLVVILVLVWYVNPVSTLFIGSSMYRHIVVPFVSSISYIYFEDHIEKTLEVIPAFVYSVTYCVILIILNALGVIEGPYPFFMISRFGLSSAILGCVALLLTFIPIVWFYYKAPFKKKHQ